jgi:hypothetical protein
MAELNIKQILLYSLERQPPFNMTTKEQSMHSRAGKYGKRFCPSITSISIE